MAKKRGAAASRAQKSRKTAPKKASWKRRLLVLMLKLTLVMTVIAAVGLVYLDAQVRAKFEGKRWALPAKVYARPLELFPGQPLSRDDLKIELKGLGYQFTSRATQPGSAEWASSRVRVFTRGFDFPDGQERSRKLLIDFNGATVSRIRDASGNSLPLARLEPVLIGGIYPKDNEDRDLIQLSEAPPHLADALIAIEDRNYYSHHGISLRGIARAMVVNIKAGRFVQGGSTLTQQLIKNFYLSSERSLSRKLAEIPMAILLDLHYSKDEILQAYLNEVYLGQEGSRAIHGFGLASQYLFAQPIRELKLHQVALMAAMVKGPSFYDPRRHPQRAKERRNLVLRVLQEQGSITAEERAQAEQQPLGVVKQQSLQKGAYPAYLDLVKRQLREEYPEEALNSEGLRVFTALDPIAQIRAEDSLVEVTATLQKRYGASIKALEGGMVVSNPLSGEVLAVVGGRKTRYQGFNRALDAKRPIGSLIKPAVYLAALEEGYTLASIIEDKPIAVKLPNGDVWRPQNYGRTSHGPVPLHRALSHSYNQSTARLGLEIGTAKVVDMLKRLGLQREIKEYPSMLLGSTALSPLEVAQLYQTIAGNGFQVPMRAIRMVTDSRNEELSRYPFHIQQTVGAGPMHLIQYALQEVVREGTARSVYSRLPPSLTVAGKTGTTNDQRDSWFAGFAGDRLAVVWLGLDNNKPLPLTGSSGALRVWTEFMVQAHPQPFVAERPENIQYHWVEDATGLMSGEGCDGARQLPFIAGTEPKESSGCGDNVINNPFDAFKRWFRAE
ncbi:penicillin-binding protein 1B [Amphritea sp. 2_MG-2023]|uniref:penicillin-binding protein 1B n=1 Tax=Amphritea TaxID=515417 RepID=UPI001C07813F|nr:MULTISPECIES: penicillin-binding protein 1B [Amphritea]MBU2966870.1 penicillin-binding protein 1B [Amphritea atlantica]MDO6420086.1 penicillin-binding protein 1B [Amphritea sp. 2_MG-2023]